MRPAVPGQARDDAVRFRLTIRTTLVICPIPHGCRERNRFARRYPKGRRLSGRPLIRMRGITQRKAGHGSNPTRRRLAPQGSQPAKPVVPGKPQAPAVPCVCFLPRRKPAFASGGEAVSSVKILPHRGRGTAGAAGGGGVSPSDRTLTPLRHSLRECHLPFQGRILGPHSRTSPGTHPTAGRSINRSRMRSASAWSTPRTAPR